MKPISTFVILFALSLTTAASFTAYAQVSLPVRFDLRDVDGKNFVTPIKLQQGGTCWTHGAWAAVEGNLSLTGNWSRAGELGPPDLAEYHLDWWNGFNTFNNDDAPGTMEGLEIHYGGDYLVTAAYMTRGEGAVRDHEGQSFETAPARSMPGFHYYYAREILWMTMDDSLNGIARIKRSIMEHGVMGTAMSYNADFMDSTSHYQSPSDENAPNHAIAIIGWDDEKETQAPKPGAWLCKNSWSRSWGDDGFFWISYFDKVSCRDREMGAISFREVERLRYDHIYFHDYHGWRATLPEISDAVNRFVITDNHRVAALSFYTSTDDVAYTAYVLGQFDGQTFGDTLAQVNGSLELRGFHTINLAEAVDFSAGDTMYVAISLSEGGHAFDRTSTVDVLLGVLQGAATVPSVSHPGESIYRSEGQWLDLYDWQEAPWPAHTANFCIKALAIEGGTSETNALVATHDPVLHQNYPNPFNPSTSITYTLPQRMWCRLSVCNMLGETVEVLAGGDFDAGTYRAVFEGRALPGGMYFSVLQTANGSQTKKMLLVK